jgi:hypothetical protein
MLFLAVAIFGLGLSLAYTWKRQGFFAYAATAFWLFMGIIAYQSSTSSSPLVFSDIYMSLFWVCMGMVITFVLLPVLTREKPVSSDIVVDDWEGEDLSAFGFGEEGGNRIRPLTPQQRWDRSVNRAARTGELRTRG